MEVFRGSLGHYSVKSSSIEAIGPGRRKVTNLRVGGVSRD